MSQDIDKSAEGLVKVCIDELMVLDARLEEAYKKAQKEDTDAWEEYLKITRDSNAMYQQELVEWQRLPWYKKLFNGGPIRTPHHYYVPELTAYICYEHQRILHKYINTYKKEVYMPVGQYSNIKGYVAEVSDE